MNSFTTKYIIATVIVAILIIIFRGQDVVTPLNNVLGALGLLAGIEAANEILKK